MSLLSRIEQDMIKALKSGDTVAVNTLRGLKSDAKYAQIEKKAAEMTDEMVTSVIATAAKKRRDSIEQFKAGGRQDLVDKETVELAVVEEYLPNQMSEAEIEAFIASKLAALGTVTQKEIGRVMGDIMKELKGKADGSVVKAILSKKVGGN